MSIYYPCDKNGNKVPFRTTTTYVTDALGVNANEKVNTLTSKLNGKSSEIINAIPSTISYSNSTKVVAVKNSNNGEICSAKLPSEPGYPPKNVSGITVSNDGDNIYLYWTDPADAYASTVALSVWGGTRVILKAGSAPTHPYDGRIIVNTTTKNQYTVSNKLTISNVLNYTTYYIGVFPFTTDGTFNTSISNVVSTTISRTKVYGFHIDPGDSNPSTAITYLNDAVSKTPVLGLGIYPSVKGNTEKSKYRASGRHYIHKRRFLGSDKFDAYDVTFARLTRPLSRKYPVRVFVRDVRTVASVNGHAPAP